jgi:ribosomal protein S18 acetylase RimI-like enzyme
VITYAEARGAVAVSLTVVDGNDHARRLYERLGFTPTGHREPRPRDPGTWRERLRLSLIE